MTLGFDQIPTLPQHLLDVYLFSDHLCACSNSSCLWKSSSYEITFILCVHIHADHDYVLHLSYGFNPMCFCTMNLECLYCHFLVSICLWHKHSNLMPAWKAHTVYRMVFGIAVAVFSHVIYKICASSYLVSLLNLPKLGLK